MLKLLFFIVIIGAFFWFLSKKLRAVQELLRRHSGNSVAGLAGARARTLTPVAVEGRIAVHGEVWKACTKSGIIAIGKTVEVVAVHPGLVLEVREVASE